jgi:hypothetical protein
MVFSEDTLTLYCSEKLPTDIAAPFEARSYLSARTDIEVICAMVSAGLTTTLGIINIANYVATHMKTQSDIDTCSVISGSADGVNWQFYVTTSGDNCDTTAQEKTLQNAVQRELEWMQKNKYDSACFKMSHGGTWEGHLSIAVNKPIVSSAKCDSLKYIKL